MPEVPYSFYSSLSLFADSAATGAHQHVSVTQRAEMVPRTQILNITWNIHHTVWCSGSLCVPLRACNNDRDDQDDHKLISLDTAESAAFTVWPSSVNEASGHSNRWRLKYINIFVKSHYIKSLLLYKCKVLKCWNCWNCVAHLPLIPLFFFFKYIFWAWL